MLIEESVLGWKEYELEVMRDASDNVVVVCSIENIDPMGVHTGDSITVAPGADPHRPRVPADARRRLRRASAGSAWRPAAPTSSSRVNPANGRHGRHRDEPARVALVARSRPRRPGSRSPRSPRSWPSATRSTRSPNDITGETPASFEPTIDYVVVKIPRWAFEKFPGADPTLTTHDEGGRRGDGASAARSPRRCGRRCGRWRPRPVGLLDPARARTRARRRRVELLDGRCAPPHRAAGSTPSSGRCGSARRVEQVHEVSGIDPWFLDQIASSGAIGAPSVRGRPGAGRPDAAAHGQAAGFVRRAARRVCDRSSAARTRVRARRRGRDPARCTRRWTPARPSSRRRRRTTTRPTRDDADEVAPTRAAEGVILGSGPNRIGQGIEFDYCCVHAALRAARGRVRDGDGQLQPRDGVHRLRHHRPPVLRAAHRRGRARGRARRAGAGRGRRRDRELGGQTPLKLAARWPTPGCRCSARRPTAIDLAEDRGRFGELLARRRAARRRSTAWRATFDGGRGGSPTDRLPGAGAPVLRARRPRHGDRLRRGDAWRGYIAPGRRRSSPEHPVLVDRFLDDAIEVDVDALCDGDARSTSAG